MSPQGIQFLGDHPGVAADLILPFFLVVDFLHHGQRQDDFVLLKGKEGVRVVQQDIGV